MSGSSFGELRLVTTTTVRRARTDKPMAHVVTREINGGVKTYCGKFLLPGEHQPLPEHRPLCKKCQLHSGQTEGDPKRFVRAAYDNGRY